MNQDTLDRERNLNNIIDRLARVEERLKRVEERLAAAVGESGQLLVPETSSSNLWALYVQEMAESRPVMVMVRVR